MTDAVVNQCDRLLWDSQSVMTPLTIRAGCETWTLTSLADRRRRGLELFLFVVIFREALLPFTGWLTFSTCTAVTLYSGQLVASHWHRL